MCTSILVAPSLFSSVVDYGNYLKVSHLLPIVIVTAVIPATAFAGFDRGGGGYQALPIGHQTLPIGCLFCPPIILNACQVVAQMPL